MIRALRNKKPKLQSARMIKSYWDGDKWRDYYRIRILPSLYAEKMPSLAERFIKFGELAVKKDGKSRRMILIVRRLGQQAKMYLIDKIVLDDGGKIYHLAFDENNTYYKPSDGSGVKMPVIGRRILEDIQNKYDKTLDND